MQRRKAWLAIALTFIMVTSTVPAVAVGSGYGPTTAASIGSSAVSTDALDEAMGTTAGIDAGAGRLDPLASAATADSGADTPPSRHLGYGGPGAGGTMGGSGEFTIGAPPVPQSRPSSTLLDAASEANSLSTDEVPAPPSISELTTAGESGQREELGESYNQRLLDEGATAESVASPADQAAGLSATVAPPKASGAGNPCPSDAPTRSFTVHAIQVPIVYNKYGQFDPNGAMYVLDENLEAVRDQVNATMVERTIEHDGQVVSTVAPDANISNPDPNVTVPLVQPLTLRAHVGDCIEIDFVNHFDRHASIHPSGVSYGVNGSDGQAVGFNNDSTAAPGQEVQYRWYVEKKGSFVFWDGANPVMSDADETLKQHGLFGSLIVYEPGVEWLDPQTGEPLRSGVEAMIEDPNGPDYRDFAVYYHDDAAVMNANGSSPTFLNGEEQSLYTMNYRGDPTGARLREDCPGCHKEETFYSSWVHGDPGGGDQVFETYVGDPVKFHIIGAQVEEKHVHHQHGHRWKSEPGDGDSRTEDAQTISPGATYNREFVAGFGDRSARPAMNYSVAFAGGGAGYVQGSPGDYIFHCHLFPHYASGMWMILRVYDKDTRGMDASQPGITPLQPLPDRGDPPAPNSSDPGYPNFIPAEVGERPPKPPLGDPGREPTPLEESAINGSGMSDPIEPGAPYADPCPADAEVVTYNLSAIQTNITYNNNGDYDPRARIYALDKDVEAIRSGEKRPRPLAIRANVGQCVQIRMTNGLPPDEEPNEMSMHVHFVGYDTLGSDGVTLGYNYDEGAEPVGDDETRLISPKNGTAFRRNSTGTITYRWYADEQGTVFWHDHLSGIIQGMHGTFGAIIVEPKGSEWLDPQTGEPIRTGTKAMIEDPNGENYREFVVFYQDFVRLREAGTGEPINPPHVTAEMECDGSPWCKSLEDHGLMGINYANAPLFHRNDADPAYAFSSWMHGDPMTPVFETYPNDPVKVRVLQGNFEEQHTFSINGMRWRQEPFDEQSPYVGTQVIGVSEQFEMHFDSPAKNPANLEIDDYLYGSFPDDDIWTGMWGLIRVYGGEVDHLQPLPGRSAPPGVINASELDSLAETEEPPPAPPDPGSPCPVDAPIRTYNVVAFQHDLRYNSYGDHDPYGVVFATAEDYLAVQTGEKQRVEPLVLRANAGECIEVTLTNQLPENMSQHTDHAEVPVQQDWNNSNRVSLHAMMVEYLVQYSDGAAAGFNYDSTVGPGETITYRWYADQELGSAVLWDMADIRSHRHHGAFGTLIVEPKGSEWLDPRTGEPIQTGTRAIIKDPNGKDFREYALAFTDKTYVVNPDGSCVVPPDHAADPSTPCNQAGGDPEDQGFKGVNYRAEPLTRRLADDSREHLVLSSYVHGDPDTPVLEAYRGDPVRFRVTQPGSSPRGFSFHLAGHVWPHHWTERTEPDVKWEGAYGFGAGVDKDIIPEGGAGGPSMESGDYVYQAMKLRGYLEAGMWGIFRVHDEPAGIEPLPDRRPDPPTNLTVTTPDREHALDLDWADHPSDDIEHYNVYRSPKPGGPKKRVNSRPVTDSSYRDTDLLPGTTYYYVVTAVDKFGQSSRGSNEANGTTKPLLRLDDVTDDVLDEPVRTEVGIEIEADSEVGLDDVEFEVKDSPTVVVFDVRNGEITTEGDAVVDATMDAENGTFAVVWDTDVEADGEFDVRLRAHDRNGRQTSRLKRVRVDNTRPEFETEVDGTLAGGLDVALTDDASVDVNASDGGSGVDEVGIKIDDGDWQPIADGDGDGVRETTVDTTTLTDGKHKLTVKTRDGAGNVRKKTYGFEVDNGAPDVDAYLGGTLLGNLDPVVKNDVELAVDAVDDVSGVESVEFEIDDNGYTTIADDDGDGLEETTIDTTTLTDGDHTLEVRVTDAVGNVERQTVDLVVDNTDPTETTNVDGTDLSLLDGPVSDTVTLEIDAADATSGVETVEIELDDGGWETVTDSDGDGVRETDLDTTTLTDGAHKLGVRVTDGAGNTETAAYDFEADNTAPAFDAYLGGTLISLLDTALSGDVTLEVDASDATSGVETVEFEIDDNGYQTVTDDDGDGVWETTIDTTQYGDGDHTLKVKVKDEAGNVKLKSFSISISNLL